MKNKFIKANTIIEYALVLFVVIAALIGMHIYMKRAVSGNWKNAVDTFGYGRQYDGNTDIR